MMKRGVHKLSLVTQEELNIADAIIQWRAWALFWLQLVAFLLPDMDSVAERKGKPISEY